MSDFNNLPVNVENFNFIQAVVTAAFSAGVTWGAIRSELRYMRRDLDELRRKVFQLSAPVDLGK